MYVNELSNTNLPQRLFELVDELLTGIAVQQQLQIQANQSLFANAKPDWCFRLISGGIRVEMNGKSALFLEPGDFIAPSESHIEYGAPQFIAASAVTLQMFAWADILAALTSDRKRMKVWMRLQNATQSILLHALTDSNNQLAGCTTEQLEFAPGKTIIYQGDPANHVYKLLTGHAEAYQHEVKVGDIYAGEFFGSIAVFTEQERTATVVAEQHCRVEAIEQAQFITMLRAQPELCNAVLKKLAHKIVDLNNAMLALEPEGS